MTLTVPVEAHPTDFLSFLDHPLFHGPAFVALVGIGFWTLLMWGWQRKKYKDGGWWHDYKDEFVISLVGALTFVVYDSQMLHLYNMGAAWVLSVIGTKITVEELGTTLTFTHYFAAGALVERLYTLGKYIYEKIHKNGKPD